MPDSAVSTALDFVQLCLRARLEPAALRDAREVTQRPGFDWAKVIEAGKAHAVTPLLQDVLRDEQSVPPHVSQALRSAYVYTSRRNRFLFRELGQVLRALDQAGLPVLLLRGAALAQGVYGDIGLRQLLDIDLLIRPEAEVGIVRRLEPLGYALTNAEVVGGQVIAFEPEITLRKTDIVEVILALHRRPLDVAADGRAALAGWFWETARPLAGADPTTRSLGPEAQVLYLGVHAWRYHRDGYLWMHDIALFLQANGAQLDWENVLERAARFGLAEPLGGTLEHLVQEWGVEVPAKVMTRLRESEPIAPITFRDLGRAIAAGNGQLGEFWRWAFPPAAYMRRKYLIAHPALVPLYYPYRWMASLARQGRSGANKRQLR